MRIKAIFNENDERQNKYYKFIKKEFPEILTEKDPEMFFVIGGDGSMLNAHIKFQKSNIPFFGKGLGTLNFIMNNFSNDKKIISNILNNKQKLFYIEVEKIKVMIYRNNKKIEKSFAINDVVIGNNIMDWHKFHILDGSKALDMFDIMGAGLCISTNIGSTGFNFNNGGKIIPLRSNLWSITGISGDVKLNEIIVPQKLVINIESQRHKPKLYIDGNNKVIDIEYNDKIVLRKSKRKFKLAFLDIDTFIKKRLDIRKIKDK